MKMLGRVTPANYIAAGCWGYMHCPREDAEATPGARKYEISWILPELQAQPARTWIASIQATDNNRHLLKDPAAPVEKYEAQTCQRGSCCSSQMQILASAGQVWGPRHCSEVGETFDWVPGRIIYLTHGHLDANDLPRCTFRGATGDAATTTVAVYHCRGLSPALCQPIALQLPEGGAYSAGRNVGWMLTFFCLLEGCVIATLRPLTECCVQQCLSRQETKKPRWFSLTYPGAMGATGAMGAFGPLHEVHAVNGKGSSEAQVGKAAE